MKKVFTLCFFIFSSLIIYAQNDLCANATTVTSGLSCTSTAGSFSGSFLDGSSSSCAPDVSQDVWYKFTATDPTMYVEVSNSINIGLNVGFELYAGDCTGTLVTCQNATTSTQGYEAYFNNNFVVGQIYYVLVMNVSATVSNQNFSICVQKYPTPANDLCANATTLTPSLSCTSTAGSFSGSFLDGSSSSCAPDVSQDVWYKFTATDPTMYVEVSNSINIGLNVGFELYAGDCSGALVTCQNATTATQGYEAYFNNNFVVGQTYYVRVMNISATNSTRNFSICVQKYPAPANDLCANATVLTHSTNCVSTSGSLAGAMISSPPTCVANASQDVWYKFVASNTDLVVSVTNSINIGLDVGLEIYSSDCAGNLLACVNQGGATSGGEFYSSDGYTLGTTYYIRVFNVSPNLSVRNFSICVQGQVLNTDFFVAKLITIYPNPVKGILTISNLEDLSSYQYEIVTMQGQKVSNGVLTHDKIYTDGLSRGLYFIKLSNGTTNFVEKFIKE